jgi:RsiW-degrading membrane proteinase PrsW (M82 family)
MLLNYGRATPVLTILGHLAYGAIVGAFVAASAR